LFMIVLSCSSITWSIAISKKRIYVERGRLTMKRWGEF
jgi:hypothetical protein